MNSIPLSPSTPPIPPKCLYDWLTFSLISALGRNHICWPIARVSQNNQSQEDILPHWDHMAATLERPLRGRLIMISDKKHLLSLWMESHGPSLISAGRFREGIKAIYPHGSNVMFRLLSWTQASLMNNHPGFLMNHNDGGGFNSLCQGNRWAGWGVGRL